MNRKNLFFIIIAILFLALVALCWWWFLGRVPKTLAPAGGFTSAPNKTGTANNGGGLGSSPIHLPTVAGLGGPPDGTYTLKSFDGKALSITLTVKNGIYTANGPIPPGQYVLLGQNGQTAGTYTITPGTGGTYTLTPPALLPAGTYTVSTLGGTIVPGTYTLTTQGVSPPNLAPGTYTMQGSDGSTLGTCVVDSSGGTCITNTPIDTGSTPPPYLGDVGTPGVDWFFTGSPDINLGSTIDTGGQPVVGDAGTVFNPTDTNQIADSNPSGGLLPNFNAGLNGTSNGLGLGGALAGAAAAGAISCLGPYAVGYLVDAIGGIGGTVGSSAASALAVITNDQTANTTANPTSISATSFGNTSEHTTDQARTVMNCVFVNIGKAMVKTLTTSLVNWINSGFQGTPSFVTNPTQFFTNVADTAAGQFIQGSALSFLCSPFKLQIKIAIAYSYANQNANQCTLSSILQKSTNFANNIFGKSNGSLGWSDFLSFTMSPTNNPYGAYAYGVNGVNGAVAKAQGQFQVQLNQGRGFLSLQQVDQSSCKNQATMPANVNPNQFVQPIGGNVVISGGTGTPNKQSVTVTATQSTAGLSETVSDSAISGGAGNGASAALAAPTQYRVCNMITTTPGSVIAGALDKTLGLPSDALNLAQSFDQVAGAIAQQVMTSFQSKGLFGLSQSDGSTGSIGYTADQQAAQATGQDLIGKMKDETTNFQQLGTVKQGEIHDIQAVQSTLNDLKNCWDAAVKKWQAQVDTLSNTVADDPALSTGTTAGLNQTTAAVSLETAKANLATAQAGSKSAADDLANYQAKVDNLNQNITGINSAIAQLEQYQSRALSLGSSGDAAALTAEYIGANVHITQTDLTTESQNRTTLQTSLTSPTSSVNTSLTQCHAL